MRKEKLEREMTLSRAFDKRTSDPNTNYGIGAVICRMVLKGKGLAVQFVFSTGMYPKNVTKEWEGKPRHEFPGYMAYDLGYHSRTPMYQGQGSIKDCHYMGGKPCYYNGSGCNAGPVLDILLEKGSDAVWEELEKYWHEMKQQQLEAKK